MEAGKKYEYKEIKAPRGLQLQTKGWSQEAALRMLMNNLDPEVAEKPEELIVYGGTGKAGFILVPREFSRAPMKP